MLIKIKTTHNKLHYFNTDLISKIYILEYPEGAEVRFEIGGSIYHAVDFKTSEELVAFIEKETHAKGFNSNLEGIVNESKCCKTR